MKPLSIKILPVLILLSISTFAQINSGVGYMHGSDKKGDTIQDYQDKPQMHSHEQVTIIKEKKLTPEEARKAGIKMPSKTANASADTNTSAGDTTAQTAATPADTTVTLSENTLIMASGCDCIGVNFIWYALAFFGLAFLINIYLFALGVRDQKRPPFASAVHTILVTIGMTLFVIYCMYQPALMGSLTMLGLASISCVALLYYDVTGRPAPKGLVILHSVLALIGVILLLIFAFKH